MTKKKFELSEHRSNHRYDWMDLQVGEGLKVRGPGGYPKEARAYCKRRGEDRKFSQKKTEDGVYVVRTA